MRSKRPPIVAAAYAAGLALGLFVATTASACPCQGSSGPGAAITSQMNTYGFSVIETARLVHGAWLPNGKYTPLGSNNFQWLFDLAFGAAYRPIRHLELGLQSAFGRQSVSAPSFSSQRTGFGDTTLNARWEAVDEPMPFEKKAFPIPAVAVIAKLRTPTGTVTRTNQLGSGRTGSIGTTASSQGLGTWEPALALDLQRTFARRKAQANLAGEFAYRLPDDALGRDRQLGPRLLAQLNVRYLATSRIGVGVVTDLGWEGDVAYNGQRVPGTAQRLWSIGGFGYYTVPDVGLRSGLMVRYAPPVNGINVNAIGATSISVSLGYAH